MIRKPRKWALAVVMYALFAGPTLVPAETTVDRCQEMEETGLLLYQQFRKGKVCKDSEIAEGWTDCLFSVGHTEILVGAIKRATTGESKGYSMKGFNVLSIGPDVNVKMFASENFDLLLKVEDKNNPEDGGCAHNEAFITLDSQVLSPDELYKLSPARTGGSNIRGERIKEVQRNLALLGYSPGEADGIFGPVTREAVEAYSRDKRLQPTLSFQRIFNFLTGDALLKGLTELEKKGKDIWEPKTPVGQTNQ